MKEKIILADFTCENEENSLLRQKVAHEGYVDSLYDEYYFKLNKEKILSEDEEKKLIQNYRKKLLIEESSLNLLEKNFKQEKLSKRGNSLDEDDLKKNSQLRRSLLVQSSFFFNERQLIFQDHFLKRDEIDKFINIIKKYFDTYLEVEKLDAAYQIKALGFKEYQFLLLENDAQRRITHNNLITLLNRINILCQKENITSLTYKNFIHATRENINNFPNRMSNDRRQAAFYAFEVINNMTDDYANLKVEP